MMDGDPVTGWDHETEYEGRESFRVARKLCAEL